MIQEQVIIIALNTLLLGGLWWFIQGPYKAYLIDKTRLELFKIRDELFDMAMAGSIPFDSKAYRSARETLNGMIRFVHQLGVTRLLMILLTHRHDPIVTRYRNDVEKAVEELPPGAAEQVRQQMMKMHRVVLRRVLFGSLGAMLLWAAMFLLALLIRRLYWLRTRFLINYIPTTAIDVEAISADHDHGMKPV